MGRRPHRTTRSSDRLVSTSSWSIIPVALGFAISLVLAIWAVRRPRVYAPITAVTGVLYTIPSLAAFALLPRSSG